MAKYRPDESLNTEVNHHHHHYKHLHHYHRHHYHLQTDTLALGVITALEEATLLRVDSATSNDYMEMEIVSKVVTIMMMTIVINFS